jgi:hypothetical protein
MGGSHLSTGGETDGEKANGGSGPLAGSGGEDLGGEAGQPGYTGPCTADRDCSAGWHCSGRDPIERCLTDPDWHCASFADCFSSDQGCSQADHLCYQLGAQGEACSVDHHCAYGLVCSFGADPTCQPRAPEDDLNYCWVDKDCDAGAFCRWSVVNQSACYGIGTDFTEYPCRGGALESENCGSFFECDAAEGETGSCVRRTDLPVCKQDADCPSEQFCSQQYEACLPRRHHSETCAGEPTACVSWAYCTAGEKCTTYPREGEPCFEHRCGAKLTCQPTVTDGHCERGERPDLGAGGSGGADSAGDPCPNITIQVVEPANVPLTKARISAGDWYFWVYPPGEPVGQCAPPGLKRCVQFPLEPGSTLINWTDAFVPNPEQPLSFVKDKCP